MPTHPQFEVWYAPQAMFPFGWRTLHSSLDEALAQAAEAEASGSDPEEIRDTGTGAPEPLPDALAPYTKPDGTVEVTTTGAGNFKRPGKKVAGRAEIKARLRERAALGDRKIELMGGESTPKAKA